MSRYLTDEDITALQTSDLHTNSPFAIAGVSHGIFSVARYYGGCKIQGASYTYFAESDELVRDDVLKWIRRFRKAKANNNESPTS